MENEKYDYEIKIVILGSSEVGKTCLLMNYFGLEFCDYSISTIGIDYKTKFFKFDDKTIKGTFIDTAGQERFNTIASNYLKNADGIVLVYAVNSKETLDKLTNWIEQIQNCSSDIPFIIVGNKIDLEDERIVTHEEGSSFSAKYNCQFFETSAKTGVNVNDVFENIVKVVYDKFVDKEKNGKFRRVDSITIDNRVNNDKKKKDCCK